MPTEVNATKEIVKGGTASSKVVWKGVLVKFTLLRTEMDFL